MRYLILLFLALNFQFGLAQRVKDGVHYFPYNPLEFDDIKIYFGPTYGPAKKTMTTMFIENNNPNKVLYCRIDTLQFIYPDGTSKSREKNSKRFKEAHQGKTIKIALGHYDRKFNHSFDRFSMNYQGIQMGTLKKDTFQLQPIRLKEVKDTIIDQGFLRFKINRINFNKNHMFLKGSVQLNHEYASSENYHFNREKIIFLDSKGNKLPLPEFNTRQRTINGNKREHLYIGADFESDEIYIDFSEALVPVEIQPVKLPEFHFFAKAPYGHEVTCKDKIELKDGTQIIGTVARLSDEIVAFRKCIDGPLSESNDFTELPRSDIKKITYSNGQVDNFESNPDIAEKYVKTMIEIHKLPK